MTGHPSIRLLLLFELRYCYRWDTSVDFENGITDRSLLPGIIATVVSMIVQKSDHSTPLTRDIYNTCEHKQREHLCCIAVVANFFRVLFYSL